MIEVRAEMVASVWKIEAAPGDVVAEGDTIAVLESMKMEIPVIAEEGGVVRSIEVTEGSLVQEGQVIAVLDEAAAR